jgi:RNA polymerase sigma-70 factor (ECF subfamily)
MSFDPAGCSDGELAALTIAGSQAAFAEIMKRHRDPVYRLIRGYIGNADEAIDLVQECFTSAYKRLDTYDQGRPLRAWLSRIAINKCRDWARRRMVRRLLLGTTAASEVEAVADPAPPADEVAADRQELDRLWAAIAELPGNLKEPLILRTIEGMSQAEAAFVLRISEKAVETRVYRARKRLSALRDAGG